jgi:ABC-type transport system substrate-binding protein
MRKVCKRLQPVIAGFVFFVGLVLLAQPALAEMEKLTIALGVDTESFNPNEIRNAVSHNLCELIMDTYFYQDADGHLQPRLATGYTVSPDGMMVTLHLRKGVKFSDGTEMKADSCKAAFDRVLDPKNQVSLRFAYTSIKETRIVDDYTVALKLSYPFTPLLPALALCSVSPFSPAAMEKYGKEIRRNPVGAGPFKLAEWVKGDRIVMVRNDEYYGRKATVKRIIWRIVPEVATREAMLKSGQVDVCIKPSPVNLDFLEKDPAIRIEKPLSTRSIFLNLNTQKFQTKDKLIRQALNYAVDKKALAANVLFGQAEPAEGVIAPILFGYVKADTAYDYNPNKAKELLKKANFDFSKPLKMLTSQGRYLFDKQVAEAVQAYFQAIGIKTELRVVDWPTYTAGMSKPLEETDREVTLGGWGPVILDGDMTLYGQFTCSVNPPNGSGQSFYCNAEFDKIMEASRREQDPTKRKGLMAKASKMVWEDCPWLFLHTERFVIGYNSKLKGIVTNPTERLYPTYVTMD